MYKSKMLLVASTLLTSSGGVLAQEVPASYYEQTMIKERSCSISRPDYDRDGNLIGGTSYKIDFDNGITQTLEIARPGENTLTMYMDLDENAGKHSPADGLIDSIIDWTPEKEDPLASSLPGRVRLRRYMDYDDRKKEFDNADQVLRETKKRLQKELGDLIAIYPHQCGLKFADEIGKVIPAEYCATYLVNAAEEISCFHDDIAYRVNRERKVNAVMEEGDVLNSLIEKPVRGRASFHHCDNLLAIGKSRERGPVRVACVRKKYALVTQNDSIVQVISADQARNSRLQVTEEDYTFDDVITIMRPDYKDGKLIGGTSYTIIPGLHGFIDYESVAVYRDDGEKASWYSFKNQLPPSNREGRLDDKIDIIQEGISAVGIKSTYPPHRRVTRERGDNNEFIRADKFLRETRNRFKDELIARKSLPGLRGEEQVKFVNRIFDLKE